MNAALDVLSLFDVVGQAAVVGVLHLGQERLEIVGDELVERGVLRSVLDVDGWVAGAAAHAGPSRTACQGYHQIALDGVYTEPEEEEAIPEFHPLPYLTSQDVADVLQLARVRILRFLQRQGAIVQRRPLEVSDAGTAVAEEGLQQLAAAAVTGQVPAGPELRQRPPVPMPPPGEVRVTGALLASDGGFTLHAATVAAGSDAVGREALVRYALRPPLAQERLKRASDDLVEIALKRPFSDGRLRGRGRSVRPCS